MSAAHTPGPWSIGMYGILKRNENESVQRIVDFYGQNDTDKANANLIAAAPDLLAALKEFDAAITEGGLFETAPQRHRGRKALIAARAAIARAEGRSP